MTKLTRIGLPLVAALGMVVPGAAASAEGAGAMAITTSVINWPPDCGNAVKSYDGGALVCFNPTGEHMFVCDTDGDGAHPEALYRGNHDSSWGRKKHYGGVGTCLDVNFTMAEDTFIQYQPQNWDGNLLVSRGPTTGWISARG
ncbi:hypothetical protein [Actinokineospora sp. UTMC 2448]|uniref:hypothetical protein n=1 Tax=Actinokineospora sp. UTMC 2448 TaxID=2268449 RepID=UPI0021643CF4|nr:hypothetical protein [Actinokineospora sp. UTMC 2448]UVS80288.1 hypothetical protein Actkin_04038 [Actinokineospora sp. UTMC 2448]